MRQDGVRRLGIEPLELRLLLAGLSGPALPTEQLAAHAPAYWQDVADSSPAAQGPLHQQGTADATAGRSADPPRASQHQASQQTGKSPHSNAARANGATGTAGLSKESGKNDRCTAGQRDPATAKQGQANQADAEADEHCTLQKNVREELAAEGEFSAARGNRRINEDFIAEGEFSAARGDRRVEEDLAAEGEFSAASDELRDAAVDNRLLSESERTNDVSGDRTADQKPVSTEKGRSSAAPESAAPESEARTGRDSQNSSEGPDQGVPRAGSSPLQSLLPGAITAGSIPGSDWEAGEPRRASQGEGFAEQLMAGRPERPAALHQEETASDGQSVARPHGGVNFVSATAQQTELVSSSKQPLDRRAEPGQTQMAHMEGARRQVSWSTGSQTGSSPASSEAARAWRIRVDHLFEELGEINLETKAAGKPSGLGSEFGSLAADGETARRSSPSPRTAARLPSPATSDAWRGLPVGEAGGISPLEQALRDVVQELQDWHGRVVEAFGSERVLPWGAVTVVGLVIGEVSRRVWKRRTARLEAEEHDQEEELVLCLFPELTMPPPKNDRK